MSLEEISIKVNKIISNSIDNCKIEDLTDDTTLNQLGADSLDSVEIVFDLEKKFNISINEEDYESLITIGSIKNLIETKLSLLEHKQ